PILAEPDGAWQSAKRWVGRHRAATLALLLSAVLAIVLTLGLATAATGSVVGLVWWRASVHQEALTAVVASVSSHARRIDASFQGYQGLLTGLAFAAETGLRDHPPTDVVVVHPDELVPAGAAVVAPGYDGTEISTRHAVVWPSPGVDAEATEEPARQLAALQPELMRVVYGSAPTDLPTEAARAARVIETGLPVVWAYVVHRDGLMVVWPGAPDYPADYEPRAQEWYAAAQGRRRPQWDPASRDPSDTEDVGLLVTASVGIWDGDEQMGVAALDVSIDHVLDELLAPPGVEGDVDTWLVDDTGRTIATSVARDAEPPPFPYPDVLAAVRSGREAGTHERGAQVIAWARLDALRWTYIVIGPLKTLSGG
ncbi:MAG: cache domain-containing protein, partial [Myxococcales bacterium]|nr:cache domain-containing protein [Myxococcales bacterium]